MQKPILEKLIYPNHHSFRVSEYETSNFEYPCHIHPEIEIVLIKKGRGIQVVGDDVKEYKGPILTLIGENLPHYWLKTSNEDVYLKLISVQFRRDFLGCDFFEISDMTDLKLLLEKAKYGIEILGKTKRIITKKLEIILKETSFHRVITLLEILKIISESNETRICSNLGYLPEKTSLTGESKIEQIHRYILENYKNNISLKDLSNLSYMSPSAFSHYFKRKTGRTFAKYINALRIKDACSMLVETDYKISRIALESGYNNISNFNRVFRNIIGKTPAEYRQQK